jgi:hypothetical protein
MNSQGNNKWNRKEVELGKKKLLKELKEEKPEWTNVYRSEEDFEYLEKELNMLIDEEESRILKK